MAPEGIDCWLEAETAIGFRTFYALHLRTVGKVMVIHGPSTVILNRIAETYNTRGAVVVRWHSVHDPAALTGVVVPHQGTAWICGELYQKLSLMNGTAVESIPAGPDAPPAPEMDALHQRVKRCLAGALAAWREYEIAAASTRCPNPMPIQPWIEQYLPPSRAHLESAPDLHFFGVPLTAEGPHPSFLAREFQRLKTTIHLTGGMGFENAQWVRRFGEQALLQGYAVHFYHDALDPARIDHLIIPELSLGMTNARSAHEMMGGRTVVATDGASGLIHNSPEAEHWWHVYQKLYTRAWQLAEEMRATKQSSPQTTTCDLSEIMAQCTA